MRGSSWIRLTLCGFVTGVVWYLLSAVFIFLVAPDFVTALQQRAPHQRWGGEIFFAVDVVMGVWAMWLYAAIAARYGKGPMTATIAAVASWIVKSLQSVKWVGLGFVQPGVDLILLAAMSLVAAIVGVVLGAWLYDKVNSPVLT